MLNVNYDGALRGLLTVFPFLYRLSDDEDGEILFFVCMRSKLMIFFIFVSGIPT